MLSATFEIVTVYIVEALNGLVGKMVKMVSLDDHEVVNVIRGFEEIELSVVDLFIGPLNSMVIEESSETFNELLVGIVLMTNGGSRGLATVLKMNEYGSTRFTPSLLFAAVSILMA